MLFSYRVAADDGTGTGPRFTAEAGGDVDGDGNPSFLGYVRPSPGDGTGLPGALAGTTCDGSGVRVPGGASAVNVPGPCDPSSGIDVF